MGYFSINKRMIFAKIGLFFVNSKDGVFVAFITVFLVSIGLNDEEAGIIVAAGLGGGAIGSILLCLIADKTRGYFAIMLLTNTIGVASMSIHPWIAEIFHKELVNGTHDNTTKQPRTYNYIAPWLHSENYTDEIRNAPSDIHNNEHQKIFLIIIAIFAGMRFCDGPNTAFCFSTVAASVKEEGEGTTLGRQLLFGGIGMAISAALAGVLIDYIRIPGVSKYSLIFFLYGLSIIFYLGSTLVLHKRLQTRSSDQETHSSLLSSFKDVVSNGSILFVMATALILGLDLNTIYGFLSLLLYDMDASGTVMGFCILTSAGSTVIAMEYSDQIIDFLGGPMNTLAVASVSYVLRLGGFYIMTEPWQAVLIDMFHFFGYGLFLPSVIKFLDEVSPPNIVTSMQSIFTAIHFQISGVIANIAGGIIYQKYGGRFLFACGTSLTSFWTLFVILYCFITRARYGYQRIR